MLINWLLKHLGNSFEIDETMYKKIYANMSERMKDKVAEIRAQAVTALHRLQVGEMQGNELGFSIINLINRCKARNQLTTRRGIVDLRLFLV